MSRGWLFDYSQTGSPHPHYSLTSHGYNSQVTTYEAFQLRVRVKKISSGELVRVQIIFVLLTNCTSAPNINYAQFNTI